MNPIFRLLITPSIINPAHSDQTDTSTIDPDIDPATSPSKISSSHELSTMANPIEDAKYVDLVIQSTIPPPKRNPLEQGRSYMGTEGASAPP